MMPMIQKELIDKLHWMTEEELLDYYAIGQSTPGIVAVNVATFIGYKQCGVLGGVFATLGIIFPSIVIITILASLINSISDFPIVQKALKGITFKANDNFDGGFRIAAENGSAYYDYSAEAVVDMLANYLSPKVVKLLKEAE